jgi:CHAD domain-containing protein
MSFHVKRRDKSPSRAVRRIARSQIDKAIGEIDDRKLDPADTVHAVRKRCKKLRGLIRLVRPGFDDFETENARFRDAAAKLSGHRDAQVMLDTFDALMERYKDQIDPTTFDDIRTALTTGNGEPADTDSISEGLSKLRHSLVRARRRVKTWSIDRRDFDAYVPGLEKTYARARKAMREVRKHPDIERFHEWRKRVKYHGYHTLLLKRIWPEGMAAHSDAADALGELLGDHHDLGVFVATLGELKKDGMDPRRVKTLSRLARKRQAALERKAFRLGTRLLAEKPERLSGRWRAYWTVWKNGNK